MTSSTLRLAGCIITDGNGRILLLHRATPKRTQWEIPGGKIEETESEAETVVREVREELGVEVRLRRRLGDEHFTEDGYNMHYTWYLGDVTAGTPTTNEPDKFDDLRYFSRADLAAMTDEISSNTLNFLAAWAENRIELPRTPNRTPLIIAGIITVGLSLLYLLDRSDD